MKVIKNILYPMQFKDYSLDMLEYVILTARSLRARLHLLHVITGTETSSFDELNDFFYAVVSDSDARLARQRPDPLDLVKVHVKADAIWNGIVTYAREQAVDLILMAAHAAPGERAADLGDNIPKVLELSHCPVLVMWDARVQKKHQSREELTLTEIRKEIAAKKK
ncbi:MAG TPA: universal stress protein [Acidobacteriota bacterium]|jgi:nucleotide-binding universal stress UspA family protein|nr:universal stress protein [Acidobacteriota bacterium]HNR39745.1 universal stress protein [Acidobacteriota bacterium]HNU01235.1 universal stress protein [Acidobacteriota bacterium]HOB54282.1 universal stress protein [Acidobacteriota bacterium]HPB28611.1 universal stress protein [Acidobacteriota bacterium]